MMLPSYVGTVITEFCLYFGKTVEVKNAEDCKVPEIQIKGSEGRIKGIRNIVSSVIDVSYRNVEDIVLHDQWIEYALTHAAFVQNSSNTAHILKELNEYLSDKVYFVGRKHSPVDILLYLFIYDVMLSFTFQEKEKYMNLSRWFNLMQHDQKLKRNRSHISFSRTRLYM